MPFHGHDPWDEQYFTAINESLDIDVPCSDHTAYTAYPGFEWLYDRLQICHRQGVRAYPHGIEPAQLPVFSKPITNLWGLSNGAGVLDEWDESCYRPGFFWMPVLRGVQLSTDLVVERGTVRWLYSMRAVTDRAGSFVAWEHVPTPARLRLRLQAWVSDVHPRYSGVWNCETIGDTIIESPLRMSPQFVDLYGREWLPAVADLYAGRPWRSVTSPVGALSHVVRLPKRPRLARCQVRVADDAALRQLRRQVSSIQLTVREGVTLAAHNADAASFRIAVVNGFDPRAVRHVAGLLLDCLEFADVDERVGLPATPSWFGADHCARTSSCASAPSTRRQRLEGQADAQQRPVPSEPNGPGISACHFLLPGAVDRRLVARLEEAQQLEDEEERDREDGQPVDDAP